MWSGSKISGSPAWAVLQLRCIFSFFFLFYGDSFDSERPAVSPILRKKLARYGREANQSDTSDTLSFTGRNREPESLRLRRGHWLPATSEKPAALERFSSLDPLLIDFSQRCGSFSSRGWSFFSFFPLEISWFRSPWVCDYGNYVASVIGLYWVNVFFKVVVVMVVGVTLLLQELNVARNNEAVLGGVR